MKVETVRGYHIVIGIEIHVQLSTESKMFSSSPHKFGMQPNTQANEIDCALPGTLPQPNLNAFKKAVKLGLMIGSDINRITVFDRKNYFYPDLPKGYQITQDKNPIILGGSIQIDTSNGSKEIRVNHAHLEEDAGKSLHMENCAGIDLNRAGAPLLEIVSEPDMRSIEETISYLKEFHALVRYLDISSANMQQGQFRADVNISVRPSPEDPFGTRAELKNINSFKFIEKALHFEINRQIDVLEAGGQVAQETRLYHEASNTTKSMRSKEDAHDYRYFPEPDLCPFVLCDDFITKIKNDCPNHPKVTMTKLIDKHNINEADARLIAYDRTLSALFQAAVDQGIDPIMAANWITGSVCELLNKHNIDTRSLPISPEHFVLLLKRIKDKSISGHIGKTVLDEMWTSGLTPDEIIKMKGLKQISNESELITVITNILQEHPKQVEQYLAGKDKLIGFFVGQAMKLTKGQAQPDLLKELFISQLQDLK